MPSDSELYREDIAFLATRIITGRLVDGSDFAIRKGRGIEARRLMRVLVEPKADRVLWFNVRVLLALPQPCFP